MFNIYYLLNLPFIAKIIPEFCKKLPKTIQKQSQNLLHAIVYFIKYMYRSLVFSLKSRFLRFSSICKILLINSILIDYELSIQTVYNFIFLFYETNKNLAIMVTEVNIQIDINEWINVKNTITLTLI